MASRIHVRWAIARDLPAMRALESAAGGDWDEATFQAAFASRSTVPMVAEEVRTGAVRGYMVYRVLSDKVACVRFVAQAEDVAAALGEKLLHKVAQHRRSHLTLPGREVWVTDTVRAMCETRKARQAVHGGVLADALEEGGCPFRWLLNELRSGAGDVVKMVVPALCAA